MSPILKLNTNIYTVWCAFTIVAIWHTAKNAKNENTLQDILSYTKIVFFIYYLGFPLSFFACCSKLLMS